MLRQGLFAFVMMILCLSFVAAEEIKGKITKIDEKGVTVLAADATEGKTYSFAKDCKFCKMVKKAKEEIKDGVKADEFKNLPTNPKKAPNVTITTNDKNEVTELILTKKKKKAAQ